MSTGMSKYLTDGRMDSLRHKPKYAFTFRLLINRQSICLCGGVIITRVKYYLNRKFSVYGLFAITGRL